MAFKDNREQGKNALRNATIQWLFQACLLVQGQAVMLAPVGYTGNLRDSIDYKVDENELRGYVGTNTEYAVYLEFGKISSAELKWGKIGGNLIY